MDCMKRCGEGEANVQEEATKASKGLGTGGGSAARARLELGEVTRRVERWGGFALLGQRSAFFVRAPPFVC